MSQELTSKDARNLILHYLAQSDKALSAREISEGLNIRMMYVTSTLSDAMRQSPKVVDISKDDEFGGRYEFVGDPDYLDPLPEGLALTYSIGNKKSDPSFSHQQDSVSYQEGESVSNFEDVDGSFSIDYPEALVLSVLSDGTKKPSSFLAEELGYDIESTESLIKKLASKNMISLEGDFSEEYEESIVCLSDKGLRFIDNNDLQKILSSSSKVMENSSSEQSSEAGLSTVDDNDGGGYIPSLGSSKDVDPSDSPVFEIPDFDNVPESSPARLGNPGKNRNYAKMQAFTLACLKEKGASAKSNVSRIVSNFMTDFGRNSIASQIDEFESIGLVSSVLKGKRYFYDITPEGEKALTLLLYGKISNVIDLTSDNMREKEKRVPVAASQKASDKKFSSESEGSVSTGSESSKEEFSKESAVYSGGSSELSDSLKKESPLNEDEEALIKELDFVLSVEDSNEKKDQIRSIFLRAVRQIRSLKEVNMSLSNSLQENLKLIDRYIK